MQLNRLNNKLQLLTQRGISYPVHVLQHDVIPGIVNRQLYAQQATSLTRLVNRMARPDDDEKKLRDAITVLWLEVQTKYTADTFTHWEAWAVDASARSAIDTACYRAGEPFEVATIDTDGRVHCQYGTLPNFQQTVSASIPRHRTSVSIVLLDGYVLIQKNFRGDRSAFLREWYNLLLLYDHANVPAVYDVDEDATIIYKSLVVGRTIRDLLADAGAVILNAQTEHDPELTSMSNTERMQLILDRGAAKVTQVMNPQAIAMLAEQIDQMHAAGVTHISLTYGNVMLDQDEQPWLIDLENSFAYSNRDKWAFQWQRDADRRQFNRLYDGDLLTEATARALTRSLSREYSSYAPVNLGRGVAMRGFWTVESGSGRWEYLNEQVIAPLVAGKRVLDLGSNNGVMPLHMLQAGALSVDGIEISAESIAAAKQMQRLFEWHDMCRYTLTLHHGSMTNILSGDWGSYDVVTALCTLYYLTESEMAAIVSRVAELAPIFIVQANDHTRQEAKDNKAQKSSKNYLRQLLAENGYCRVKEFAPVNYSRPLLVGYRHGSKQ